MAKTPDRPLTVLLVGFGTWGRDWAQVVRQDRGTRLVGVVDVDPGARRRAQEEFGLDRDHVVGSLQEGLALQAESALIVTPPATHSQVALAALCAGKHVLVEKPLAETLADVGAIATEAKTRGLQALACQHYRWNGAAPLVRQIIAEGKLGPLVHVKAEFRRDMAVYVSATDFRSRGEHAFLFDMAIHHFDLLRALTGRDVASVFARAWHVPGSPFTRDGALAAVMELECGVTAVYEGSSAAPDGETSWNAHWKVLGERGTLTWKSDLHDEHAGAASVVLHDSPTDTESPQPLPGAPRGRHGVLDELRRAVRTDQSSELSASSNLLTLATVIAAGRSISSGEVVSVGDCLPPNA
jgi:predicted dehydrogenase